MTASTITSKGQTTIPAEIRAYLKLEAGDRLEFIPQGDGKVMIVPAKVDITELRGILPKPRKPVSLEDMHRTIEECGSGKA